MRLRIERITQQIYIGSLLFKSYIQSPETTRYFTKQSNNLDYKPHTKEVILNPSKRHTSFDKQHTTDHKTPSASAQKMFT